MLHYSSTVPSSLRPTPLGGRLSAVDRRPSAVGCWLSATTRQLAATANRQLDSSRAPVQLPLFSLSSSPSIGSGFGFNLELVRERRPTKPGTWPSASNQSPSTATKPTKLASQLGRWSCHCSLAASLQAQCNKQSRLKRRRFSIGRRRRRRHARWRSLRSLRAMTPVTPAKAYSASASSRGSSSAGSREHLPRPTTGAKVCAWRPQTSRPSGSRRQRRLLLARRSAGLALVLVAPKVPLTGRPRLAATTTAMATVATSKAITSARDDERAWRRASKLFAAAVVLRRLAVRPADWLTLALGRPPPAQGGGAGPALPPTTTTKRAIIGAM